MHAEQTPDRAAVGLAQGLEAECFPDVAVPEVAGTGGPCAQLPTASRRNNQERKELRTLRSTMRVVNDYSGQGRQGAVGARLHERRTLRNPVRPLLLCGWRPLLQSG